MVRYATGLVLAAAWSLSTVAPVHAYVDLAPTLGKIVRESQTITVAEVDRFNRERGAVILKKVRDLKGQSGADPIKQALVRENEAGPDRAILEWAEPAARCLIFLTGRTGLVCVGEGWYQIHAADDGWWRIGVSRPDLPLAYYGTVSRLAAAIPRLVTGKTAVITALPHGADREGASFDLALNRASLPGLVKVERIRASLRMPDVAMAVGANAAYVVGQGQAGREDVPGLREKLRADDALVRAESAADLGSLGAAAADAAGDLAKRLGDENSLVRFAAAAALLRIKPRDTAATEALAKGLASDDAGTRRRAARATGLAGASAAPLATPLARLLSDADSLVRRTALQAIATLGPAASPAREAVTVLLGTRETAIDAADALGRMGPAARPSLKGLAKMLSAEAATERWAAVRAMAQIGGDDAAPAAQFMIRELPTASEIDGYNMLIYLALLGPVAHDAIPAVRSARIRNMWLKEITAWVINPGTELPRVGFGMGNGIDPGQLILESFVREVGDHLKPVALVTGQAHPGRHGGPGSLVGLQAAGTLSGRGARCHHPGPGERRSGVARTGRRSPGLHGRGRRRGQTERDARPQGGQGRARTALAQVVPGGTGVRGAEG